MRMNKLKLIEKNEFPFELLSKIAEKESWRKEIHRPIYHTHKWWAKRLGSVFRGILLGSILSDQDSLLDEFYNKQDFSLTVFDPFVGSGTTLGEAHKLGLTALGRDINPVAVESIRVALGSMDKTKLLESFEILKNNVGGKIKSLYSSQDSQGKKCDVLYFFWVMQAECTTCNKSVDLFPSWVISKNAYPGRKPEIQVLCPKCGDLFTSTHGIEQVSCRTCSNIFNPSKGITRGANAVCPHCNTDFKIKNGIHKKYKPNFRLYAKLVLTENGKKEYLPINKYDLKNYSRCISDLDLALHKEEIVIPNLDLASGHNTNQAMSYGFNSWKDFFNDRQLLALGLLHSSIVALEDKSIQDIFLTIFSGVLEFNNIFASYKGEGTGAVRHIFAHHILKPEKTPIEANVWGTPKSSGSFINVFHNKLVRAINYRHNPIEVNIDPNVNRSTTTSLPFSGKVENNWPKDGNYKKRAIYLSCGDSSISQLKKESIDLVVTDPPFFDNVNYSELADFFYAWQQLSPRGFIKKGLTTRSNLEVQDSNPEKFSSKLMGVFKECNHVLKKDGLLVFTYHHSRDEGWISVANSIIQSGFTVVNVHPVKAEMSGATPKSQAKEPIQIDVIIVCRKKSGAESSPTIDQAKKIAEEKAYRLEKQGFMLSHNDRKVIMYGQLLTTIKNPIDTQHPFNSLDKKSK